MKPRRLALAALLLFLAAYALVAAADRFFNLNLGDLLK